MKVQNAILIITILFLVSCDDVIEKDISKDIIILRSPLDGYATGITKQTFWWDTIKGASKYRLTIASPRVDSANILILDTLITKTQFSATLPVGDMQWCIKALNSDYESAYSCHLIKITN